MTLTLRATDLLQNWDFNNSLNNWSTYSQPPLSWSWTGSPPSDASGGAAVLSGSGLQGRYWGYIYQSFTTYTEVNVNVSTRIYVTAFPPGQFNYLNISISIRRGLTSPPLLLCTAQITAKNTWVSPPLSCTPSIPFTLPPGSYVFVANYTIYTKPGRTATTVTVYTDFLRLYAPSSFSGDVIEVVNSDSKAYYARLLLDSSSSLDAVTGSIVLRNSTSSSEPISISSGIATSTSTSWLVLPPLSSGYIYASIWMPVGSSATLNILLEYCSLPSEQGVCVYYPVQLVLTS